MQTIKPPALRPGDTIGIVSPSWFGGEPFVPRAMRGIQTLERLGFRIRVGDHAFNNHGHVSDSAKNRVADIHAMFRAPDVRAIIATIGGDHSCHLLPHLDWDLVAANPKIFLGASDITVLNNAIWSRTGLVTFNGPSLMTEWAEYPEIPNISLRSAIDLLTKPEPFGVVPIAAEWTAEFLDWEAGEDLTRRRRHRPSEGVLRLVGGTASGTLVGGCLESLEHLRGTPYWPRTDGAILFLETSESCEGPASVDAMLMDYENMGVFDVIAGLVVARPYGMDDAERARFWEIVTERTAPFGFPVLGNLDFGHTSPQVTIPVGVAAELDATAGTLTITEAAVGDPVPA